MPMQINTPGWKVQRISTARGAARAAVQALPGVPPEFLTGDSRVAEEVVLEPAGAGRGREAAPASPVLDISSGVEATRTAVLAIRHPSGALTFHLPVQRTSRGVRGPAELRFQVQLRPSTTRGLIGAAVKAILITVTKIAADRVTSLLLPRLAEVAEQAVWKERGLKEGWLKVTRDSLAAGVLQPGRPVSPDRSLLFIHGTFSNAASAYRHLAATDFFDRIRDTYGDRLFAFDHFTVSRTPEENARMLLESLPEQTTTFDVVAHSRGGLVLRTIVERARQLGAAAHRFKLNRAVLVASPNEGTPLATPQRWDDTIGWLANVIEMFPDNPFTTGASFVANGLVWLANHATGDLPGLHAMDGAGELIGDLQAPPGPPADAYSALVANYQPSGAVLQRLLDAGIDQFFGSANDLVVPSEGGWRVDRAGTTFIPSTRIGCFGPGGNLQGDAVTHVSFFSEHATSDFLVKALLGQPQALTGVDPRKRLPDRRLIRRGISDAVAVSGERVTPVPEPGARDGATHAPLRVTVINGDLTFEKEALLLGHYHALRLTGTEKVMDRLIGGAMNSSLAMGVYPVAVGTSQVFVNHVPNLERGSFLPRPKAVIVAGLGEEGKLRAPALAQTVRQAVASWAQRVAEGQRNPPDSFELAATLLGSGGTGITAADAGRLVAQGVYEANALIRETGSAHPLPVVSHLRLIELYLDRAADAWRALRMQAEATPDRYIITDEVKTGTGPMRRPPDSGYRGAEFDFISAETKADKHGTPIISYTLDTRRARSEVRGQRAQSKLLNELVATASNDQNRDEQIGRTLFNLLIPVELEPYLSGSGEMQIELDPQTAAIPWELLDTRRPADDYAGREGLAVDDSAEIPWAIRVKLLRKLRIAEFRERVRDATPEASALVIGEPACPDEYPRLHGARLEAIAVRECLSGALSKGLVRDLISEDDLVAGPNARTVLNALFERPWRLVHIAGHGVLGQDGHAGGVVLSNGAFLGPDEIGNMRTVPELVFVNCCHVGSADAKELLKTAYDRANFASGVAGALIGIGVRCVVAAGWAVDDEAARVFAETFYRALIEQDRFMTAVGRAREAAREASPGSNTWAAYQCYGDPDWVFRGTRAEIPTVPDFSGVPSAVSVTLALDRLITQSKYQGADPAAQLESLRALEARTKSHGWGTHGDVAELFGTAFVEAGDVETGLRWYEIAVAAPDGRASIKAAEQLANGRSRLAWEIVDKALRHRDAMRERVRTERRDARKAAERARASAERSLAQAVKRAGALIGASLALLEKLIAIEPTLERHSLVGSAYKRRALIDAAGGRATQAALASMKASYDAARKIGEAGGAADLYYPLSNCLTADAAVSAGKLGWRLDRQQTESMRMSLKAQNASDPDFWSVVGVTELEQFEAMAKRRLSGSVRKLGKAYEDLHRRVSATRMWASVYDNACLVLLHYSSRVPAREKRAAETLLSQLRGYAYPAQA